MTTPEKPHYTKGQQAFGERARRLLDRTRMGRAVSRAFNVPNYPYSHYMSWDSRDITAQVTATADNLKGDREAGWLAVDWLKAMIMASPADELSRLQREVDQPNEEAVAFFSKNVWRVGTSFAGNPLFEKLNVQEMTMAMMLGRGPLVASMGVWVPSERTFVGVNKLRVVEPAIYISALPSEYPGMPLAT